MTASLDGLLGRVHRGSEYNCLHFAREAWELLTGEDLAARLAGGVGPRTARGFERLPHPVEPCLVLMRRRGRESHVGVRVGGLVAHLTERGARLEEEELAALGFNEVRYYR